jgi:hypothetical protein
MRWVGSEAVPADTLWNPATGPAVDVPYEEGYVYDPEGKAGFSLDLDGGIIDMSEPGQYFAWASAEWSGTGSAGETLACVLDFGASGSFSTNRVVGMIVADAVNQNMQIPVSRWIHTPFTDRSLKVDVYHTDAGGNDIGTVWFHVVQIHDDVQAGEYYIPS